MRKKKSLGQHFLHNLHYVRAMAGAAALVPGERVFEIGPGEGVLTQELLARGVYVTTIEKDARLIPILQAKFADEIAAGKLTVIEGDALEIDSEKLLGGTSYKVVANIPYYITGALLRTFLSRETQPSTLVFLIQKEVADRIVNSRKESLLSLSVKAFGTASVVCRVPAGAFNPPPEVDSAILLVSDISRTRFINQVHEEMFFTLLRAGFAQKRKLLRRNIDSVLGAHTAEYLAAAGIPENARAEDVPLLSWLTLARATLHI